MYKLTIVGGGNDYALFSVSEYSDALRIKSVVSEMLRDGCRIEIEKEENK